MFFFFFKQKTAYEMQRGLVGSEMCIRDRYQRRVHGSIVKRTLKVSRILQARFGSVDKFNEDLKTKLEGDSYGNVAASELEKYFSDTLKDNLNKREVSRRDLEGFLSAFLYNRYKMTNVNRIAPMAFSDDTEISKKILSIERANPPPAKIAENTQKNEPTTVEPERMRQLLKELQLKSFAQKREIFKVYREYDHDGDGYISYLSLIHI
eukprot:TRINITY_DN10601_c0_g1_i2.p1 TRINITY_DN10601_c0_g1~~TRINITY_DN10601_c0_g1_i2.p1  ORF type:complete len:208 (+),score=58.51 TRINITY_DN10601_c0_g1_i2:127-750(+)